jgi:hypothetical protein
MTKCTVGVAGVSWVVAIAIGQTAMWFHANTPGRSGRIRPDWPSSSWVRLAIDRPTLIFFAHPKCPCTHASLDELSSLLSEDPGRVDAHVVFLRPPGTSREWGQTRSRALANGIHGVKVEDEDGRMARQFGAHTSGHVVIYGPDGRLRFRGGIVGSRGQSGNNPSRRAARAAILHTSSVPTEMPDFGCPLFDEDAPFSVERP